MIEDGKHNALLYPKRLSGEVLFGGFVGYMWKIINDERLTLESKQFLKIVRNSLWGALCQMKTKRYQTKDSAIRLPSDAVITEINEDAGYVYAGTTQDYFVTDFARIGVFLTAYGRKAIVGWIKPYIKDVIRTHTDSMTLVGSNHGIKTSTELGGIKLEAKKSGKMIVFRQLNKQPEMLYTKTT